MTATRDLLFLAKTISSDDNSTNFFVGTAPDVGTITLWIEDSHTHITELWLGEADVAAALKSEYKGMALLSYL